MAWTERRSFTDRTERLPDLPSTRAERAMRRHNMMIGLVCDNLASGQDAFFGVGQFIEETGDARQHGEQDIG